MSKLVYITNTSLDGYIEDRAGDFDWVNPDQVFTFITELLRPAGTFLYGRRLYETMGHWDAPVDSYPPEQRDFDAEAIHKLKRESSREIHIGGAELAGLALEAGLLDECHLFLNPVIVGGGKPAFPVAMRQNLELLETRRFETGVIHVRYRFHNP